MPAYIPPQNIPNETLYTKKYNKFRGADFSTDTTLIDDTRSPLCQNLISDLDGFPEKRVGWRTLQTLDGQINGIYFVVFASGMEALIAHAGTNLYQWAEEGDPTLIYESMNNARTTSFAHGGRLYILDGANFIVCTEDDGEIAAAKVKDGTCFIPTTVISITGDANTANIDSEQLEAVNLISDKQKNSLIGDGISTKFALSGQSIESVDSALVEGAAYAAGTAWARTERAISFIIPGVPSGSQYYLNAGGRTYLVVDANGTAINPSTLVQGNRAAHVLTTVKDGTNTYYLAKPYTYVGTGTPNAPTVTATLSTSTFALTSTAYQADLTAGTIEFALPPPESSGGSGVDNIVIQFTKEITGNADKVEKCTIAEFYGFNSANHIFIAGNPDEPNIDYYSGLDDPTYWPDTSYTKVGADTSKIMGYVRHHESLAIIKNDNQQDHEIYIRTAEMLASGTVIFPVTPGVKGTGAISKYAMGTLRDDPLFLAREGVFALISLNTTDQRSIQDRSKLVNSRLKKESGLENAVSVTWEGFYILCVNGNCYVADSRQKSGKSNTEEYGYEWYFWTNIPARVFLERGGVLYFGTSDGKICKFNTDIATMARYNDDGEPIVARWATKADTFGDMMRRKTMVKKGSGVMIKPYTRSSIMVYAATDARHKYQLWEETEKMDIFSFEDIDFSRFTFNTLDGPQVIPFNAKIKKFITLQLFFENAALNEGFGIYGTQIQFAFGNYVK
jgi:hypothetical protein